jgi:hypothetical protein
MLTPRSTHSTPILEFNQPIVCFVNTEEQEQGCLNESSNSYDSISEDEEIEGQPIPRPRNGDSSRLKLSVHRFICDYVTVSTKEGGMVQFNLLVWNILIT